MYGWFGYLDWWEMWKIFCNKQNWQTVNVCETEWCFRVSWIRLANWFCVILHMVIKTVGAGFPVPTEGLEDDRYQKKMRRLIETSALVVFVLLQVCISVAEKGVMYNTGEYMEISSWRQNTLHVTKLNIKQVKIVTKRVYLYSLICMWHILNRKTE